MGPGKRRGRPPYDDVLTPSEWRTLHAVQHGLSNRQIAERRKISLDGVKFHVSNALGKLGLSNRSELRHWFAAPRGSALGAQEDLVDVKLGPLGQVSRSVSDLARSKAWYRDVLGLKHLYTFGPLAFFDCAGTRLFLEETKEPLAGESVLYFQVSSIAQAYRELRARGACFSAAPHMIHRHEDGTEEWMAFFDDPDGRLLAIMSQVTPPAAPVEPVD